MIRVLVLVTAVAALALLMWCARGRPGMAYAWPVGVWLLHLVVFFGLSVLRFYKVWDPLPYGFANEWSLGLYLHATLTVLLGLMWMSRAGTYECK